MKARIAALRAQHIARGIVRRGKVAQETEVQDEALGRQVHALQRTQRGVGSAEGMARRWTRG